MKKLENSLWSFRKLNWVPAVDERYMENLLVLGQKMETYYRNNQYYEDITPASLLWQSLDREAIHRDIIQRIRGKKVLEVGCGKAEVLSTGQINFGEYSGTDFSDELMQSNTERFPGSEFRSLKSGGLLPFEDNSFDAVFSLFVIEHAVDPAIFLREKMRVLCPGGNFILLCPDFLGRNRMTSQRIGYSMGSGRIKIQQGRWWDAFVTIFDSRIRIPFHCFRLRLKARWAPQFFINLSPLCFSEKRFSPDIDAVYVTYAKEIMKYLEDQCSFETLSNELNQVMKTRRLIYLVGTKL